MMQGVFTTRELKKNQVVFSIRGNADISMDTMIKQIRTDGDKRRHVYEFLEVGGRTGMFTGGEELRSNTRRSTTRTSKQRKADAIPIMFIDLVKEASPALFLNSCSVDSPQGSHNVEFRLSTEEENVVCVCATRAIEAMEELFESYMQ